MTLMISPSPKNCRFCTSLGRDMPRRGEILERKSQESWPVAVVEPWRLFLYTLDRCDCEYVRARCTVVAWC